MERRLIDDESVVVQSAEYICDCFRRERTKHGDACSIVVGLSGGGSPKELYRAISNMLEPEVARCLTLIQIDERVTAVSSDNSNQNLVCSYAAKLIENGAVFEPVLLASCEPSAFDDTHAQDTALSAAEKYNETIRAVMENADYSLAILGAGTDGHTASVFPDASNEEQELARGEDYVFASRQAHMGYYRVSLTYATLFTFSSVVFYVPGKQKQAIVQTISRDSTGVYPAGKVLHKHPASVLIAST